MSYVLRLTLLSLVSCLASSLLPCAAASPTFVYVAELGKFGSDGTVETIPLTTNVTMTVALYDRKGGAALWNRRLDVPVWDGKFAVELDDDLGTMDSEKPATSATLAEVFARADKDAAWWVGVSKMRLAGTSQPPPGLTDDSEKFGKLTAVPFAVEAGSAEAARGDFTVGGAATVRDLAVTESIAVSGPASFSGDVSFQTNVVFSGLTVTGTLTAGDLDTRGKQTVIRAQSVEASKAVQAPALTIAGAAALTPKDAGFTSLTRVTVGGDLVATDVSAEVIAADTVSVSETLTLQSGCGINWKAVGSHAPAILAPNGAYGDEATVTDSSSKTAVLIDVTSGSDKDSLGTLVTATKSGVAARIENTTETGSEVWCRAGADSGSDAQITLTSLCPLAGKNDSVRVKTARVLSYTIKELSK